jgi:hypothetical protein
VILRVFGGYDDQGNPFVLSQNFVTNGTDAAGGSSADVALCDLRMTDGSSSRVVQHYRPSGLAMADNVSVSGLDLSRDKQELLVSYESDQIYTFPVFPRANSPAGPTVDQLSDLCNNAEGDTVKSLSELAAYGGHLNRFTFLKVRIELISVLSCYVAINVKLNCDTAN